MNRRSAAEPDAASLHAAAAAECERENIRSPDRIQTFGCMVAVDPSGRIAGFSANAASMLGRALRLGGDAATVLGAAMTDVLKAFPARPAGRPAGLPDGLAPPEIALRFEILAHRRSDLAIVEFIPREAEPAIALAPVLDTATDVFRECLKRAERVRDLTGYDRVMVYRFHEDFSGEVIAELRDPELPPYLGLRYPATDIPSQARALYLENRARIIPNVYAPTAGLVAGGPIDLSMASLRAVSLYHIEYLHNMRVAATLTLSIVVDGALWGLIACHHASERMVSHALQEAALAEAEALAKGVAEITRREALDAERVLKGQWAKWTERLGGERLAEPLLSGVNSIIAELRADGGALIAGDVCLGVGATPDAAWLLATAGPGGTLREDRLVTDRLADVASLPPTLAAAGAMMARIASDPPTTLFVFRRAQVQEVHWGGDPRGAIVVSPRHGRPSPRRSFTLWRELVRDRARSWTFLERAIFATCVERLAARLAGDRAGVSLTDQLAQVYRAYSDMADSHRLLVDALPEGVAMLLWTVDDGRSRLLYANRAFINLFGLELSEIVGSDPDHILERTRLDRTILRFDGDEEKEVDVWSPALGVRRVRARRDALVRYHGQEGSREIERLLLSDTTAASRAHNALLSAVSQAQAAENARGAILRNMSHELRTPLNAILGYSDLMTQELVGPLGDPAYREAAEEIRSSAQHLLALINETLELARLREGKVRIEPAPRDMGDIVRGATRLLGPLATAKRISLQVTLPDAPLVAEVDETALRQIVINLVSNAIKFTLEGGRVEIVLRRGEGGKAELSVTDTGIGIAADELVQLFIPFSQVDSSLRRTTGGSGLGLAIVKELVQLHGGAVDVVSQEQVGSTFSVRLPAWRVESAS